MRRRSPNLKNKTAERLNFRLNLTEQGQVVRWYIHELRFKLLIFEKKSKLPVPTWSGSINEKAKKGQKKNRTNKQKKKWAQFYNVQLISFRNLFANIEKALTGKWISNFFSAKI